MEISLKKAEMKDCENIHLMEDVLEDEVVYVYSF